MSKDNSGPAFPTFPNWQSGDYAVRGGLTKREWFAGMALMGYCATKLQISSENVAKWCFDDADAMIAESNREQGESNGK